MSLKKLLAALTSLILLVGIISIHSNGTSYQVQAKVKTSNSTPTYTFSLGGPIDPSIANQEKIIEMLKREGKIAPNATYEEAQKQYLNHMQIAAKANQKMQPSKLDSELKAKQNQRVQKYSFEQSKPDTNPKKVNILVLLVDYSDFAHSNIQPAETSMYYKDYSHQHYQDMLFGSNGYTGPNGEKLVSMKQYYAQQSGGSLDVEGTVAGWYTLPNTAAYYGATYGGSNDIRPRNAVADALNAAAKDPNINLADFDKEDPYDIDGDGNLNEPDGIIDYLMVLHAGVGEEAGGGSLGSDAIWSHSWDLGGVYSIPGTSTNVPYWGGQLGAYHYTIEPEDGATGVFAHEFGHNLGLPDEYDTVYSGPGEPISMWSIMSSGSWAGKIGGTEPTGFSPYAKEIYQALYGGNWQKAVNIDFNKLTDAGARVTLKQADESGQAVRINLPDKVTKIGVPTSGQYDYYGGIGTDGTPLLTNMTTSVDLTGKTSAALNFKTWYDIENGWDYASVQAREVGTTNWTYLKGNITTTEGVEGREVVVPYGITGNSKGWVDAIFDLSAFAGKKIELKFEYATDSYTFGSGFYVDDIQVIADNSVILSDDVEGTPKFTFNGFNKNTGKLFTTPQYYLVEWRNHHGVDNGLAHIDVLGSDFSYDPGMVVWYVDDSYTDNWTGAHPGDGYLGVVDADTHNIVWQWTDPTKAPVLASSNQYQMHDAAFSKNKETEMDVDLNWYVGRSAVDTYRFPEPNFDDSMDYTNPQLPYVGRNIPNLGLKIQITDQASDNSYASIAIMK